MRPLGSTMPFCPLAEQLAWHRAWRNVVVQQTTTSNGNEHAHGIESDKILPRQRDIHFTVPVHLKGHFTRRLGQQPIERFLCSQFGQCRSSPSSQQGTLQRQANSGSVFQSLGGTGSLPMCALACSRFPLLLLAVGFVDLLMLLSPVVTISTALLSHSLGFPNRCKNKQLISLFTLLNTSTPFEMKEPCSIRYRRPASFSRNIATVSPTQPIFARLSNA
jgi:hypothetical protein